MSIDNHPTCIMGYPIKLCIGGINLKGKICWKSGNASLISASFLLLLGVVLIILLTECSNLYWCNTVVTTRTDAIADGAALYAQSYDWKLNKPQAQIMSAMLTTANDSDTDRYKLSTSVSFQDDSTMTVKGTASTKYFYPGYQDTEEYLACPARSGL